MIRWREDKALEVYTGNQLIGWLTGPFCDAQGKAVVVTTCEPPGGSWDLEETDAKPFTSEQRVFNLMNRRWSVSDFQLQNLRDPRGLEELLLKHVPAYAKSYVEFNRDAKTFEWKAVQVTDDDHEWLFETPFFEPAETGADHDTIIENKLRYLPEGAYAAARERWAPPDGEIETEPTPGEVMLPEPKVSSAPVASDDELDLLQSLNAA